MPFPAALQLSEQRVGFLFVLHFLTALDWLVDSSSHIH